MSKESIRVDEKKLERDMLGDVQASLDYSQEVPFGEDPRTGIDVRNGGPEGRERKDALALYPAEPDPTDIMYLRTQDIGGIGIGGMRVGKGKSMRAYVGRQRTGKREGQYVNVTTDYDSLQDSPEYPKGSRTTVTVYGPDNQIIRRKERKSSGVGLSPLVATIVTHGVDSQIQKIKESKKE